MAATAQMTLEEKIGQMFVLFAYGPDAAKPDARNTALYGVATPAQEAVYAILKPYRMGRARQP